MRLSTRIQKLLAEEVDDVVQRLHEARQALVDAEEQQRDFFHSVDKRNKDWLGRKDEPVARDEMSSWNLRELRASMDPVMAAVEAWKVNGTQVFFPAVQAWDEGDESVAERLPELVAERQRLVASYEAVLPDLRQKLLLIAPVRVPVNRLIAAVQAQQRVEDVEVIPAVLSGQRTTTTQATGRRADRYKTSDDVARSLRMARPTDLERAPREPDPPAGLLGTIKRWFGG